MMGDAYSQWSQIKLECHSLDSPPKAYRQFHCQESVRGNLGVWSELGSTMELP
jgi:hypothetical protein